MRNGLRSRQAHPQAGEQARADIDGHQADLRQLHLRLLAEEPDGRRESLGMAPVAGGVKRGDDALVPADGHADLRRRCLDAEH